MDSIKPKRWVDTRQGRWIAEANWPSDNIDIQTFHLGEGVLSSEQTTCKQSVSSPQDCGANAGEFFPFAFGDELPDEQSRDDKGSLCFDGDVQSDSLDIIGAPRVHLALSSDKPNAQIAVRLLDIQPDGTSALITYGVLNLTHRDSHEFPVEMEAGKSYSVSFTLDQIAFRLPSGHRLRVAMSTSYWPTIWPSPEAAKITLQSGSIEVPVRKDSQNQDDEWQFESPVGSTPWQTEPLRAASYTRTEAIDTVSGIVTMAIDEDSGEQRDLEHGLISGSWFKERFYIHPDDPLSARATSEWEQTGGRDGQMWRTHANAEMTCDKDRFYVTASLKAFKNDEVIFEREYKDSVERSLV